MHPILSPDLFQFAIDLRETVESQNPMTQGKAFALGRNYGLRVSTMAGMANCSESHVRRMLLLLKLSGDDATAVKSGAPYTPYLVLLREPGKDSARQEPELQRKSPLAPVKWAA